jgi:GWxTD domain-containing protein
VLTYARALAELESQQAPRLKTLKTALAANGGSLLNRIRRLIDPAQPAADNLPGAGAAWAMTLLWAAGVGVATLHGAQTPVPMPSVVNFGPVGVTANPSPFAAPPNAASSLASHARNTLLFDPFLSAQVAQAPDGRDLFGYTRNAMPWRKWLDEDVVYIISDEERKAFLNLNTDDEREHFIGQFWLIRDPTPNTAENEFKEEHYRRIAYTNEHFGAGIPGWKTDRGHVYIKYGPPDEIEAHPSGQPYPTEDWRYRWIEGFGNNFAIEFADTSGTGEYRIAARQPDVLKDSYSIGNSGFGARMAAALRQATSPADQEVDTAIATETGDNRLPMNVRFDFMRGTEASVLVNITMQFENRDLQFQLRNGVEKAIVNIFGRITSMTRRPISVFEPTLEADAPPELLDSFKNQKQIYQQSVPLAAGRYRLNIVAKDTMSGNVHAYEADLNVPYFDAGKLFASSLVLADKIEKLPARQIGGSMFAIGDTKVRPRVGSNFTTAEQMGVFLQVYNFVPDAITQRPVGAVEYEVDKAGSNEKIMDLSDEIGTIQYASASQVTIQKLLPLTTFAPGNYTLKMTVTDRNGHQSVQRQENFTVTSE